MHGLPIAVGGSLASAVPRSVYLLLPAQHRAALEGFYSPQLPPPTPTSAPHRPASGIAEALGLADLSTTTPFTAVLEAVRTAPTNALANALVLCPAASPAIQRLLLRRVRATAAVQSLRADDAAALRVLPDDGDCGDGGDAARVTSGADEAGSAAGQDKDADTGDAKSGTGGPTRGPS